MGCFVRDVKKWHGMFCSGMFCLAPPSEVLIENPETRQNCFKLKVNNSVNMMFCELKISPELGKQNCRQKAKIEYKAEFCNNPKIKIKTS